MTTKARILKARRFWRPRHKLVSVPCATCPFREDNDNAFAAFVLKMASKIGVKNPQRPAVVRASLHATAAATGGEFVCHHTVYTEDFKKKPASQHRQCAGAAEYYRSGKDLEGEGNGTRCSAGAVEED